MTIKVQTHAGLTATESDIEDIVKNLRKQLPLIRRRLSRLRETQKHNPKWAAYDKYADAVVGIDTRIEEQQACLEYAEEEIQKYEADISRLEWREEMTIHRTDTNETLQVIRRGFVSQYEIIKNGNSQFVTIGPLKSIIKRWMKEGMPNMKEHTNFCDSCKYVRPATLYAKPVTARNKRAKDAEEKKLRHLCSDCRKLADEGKI